jgi:phenylalanyl-tRNA synthetase beta chain
VHGRDVGELLAALGFPVDGVAAREGTEVLDVDITPNRGDAMSHRGMAREIAAKLRQPLTPLEVPVVVEGVAAVEVRLESAACPVYSTAILELGTGATPQDVQAFLLTLESTPKRLPAVDASNDLLHRYGHPTHAFDADRIRGAVAVRWAKAGETLTTLDGVTRTLVAQDLVIADESGPIALAGVMGGDGTKVTETTRRVLLESAGSIQKLPSAAPQPYGRFSPVRPGADRAMALIARDLLVGRLQAWCGATLLRPGRSVPRLSVRLWC